MTRGQTAGIAVLLLACCCVGVVWFVGRRARSVLSVVTGGWVAAPRPLVPVLAPQEPPPSTVAPDLEEAA